MYFMLIGNQIADISIVVASTDPCMSCTNRVAITNGSKKYIIDKETIHKMSIEKTRGLMK